MSDEDFRETLIRLTMDRRGCDRAEAEVILDRVADRLAGHTHDEVVAKYPMPPGDSQQGTAA